MESVLPEAKDTARGIPASEQNQGVHSRSVRVRASWSVLFVDAAQQLCSPWLLECDARTVRSMRRGATSVIGDIEAKMVAVASR